MRDDPCQVPYTTEKQKVFQTACGKLREVTRRSIETAYDSADQE